MDEVTRIFIFAIAFSLSAVVLVLLSFVISRRRKQQHEKQLLEETFQTRTAALLQVSRDLHDDIGSSLSGINLLTLLAQEQLSMTSQTETKELLQKINVYTTEVIEKVSDMAWLLKPDQESFSILINKINRFATAACLSRDIRFSFVDAKNIHSRNLTLPQRKAIYLISKEAINNAVKYADCTTLLFEISDNMEQCVVRVVDDGCGFQEQGVTGGNGLINMRIRAEQIGARLNIASGRDAGTTVELIIKYP